MWGGGHSITWYTHTYITADAINLCLHQKHIKSEIGSQPTMCQVHTGAYVSLLAPRKTGYTACHPRKTTTFILHVVPITTHMHDRRKSSGKKKQRKDKKRLKETKKEKAKNGERKDRKETTGKARKDKTRRGSKERKREKVLY